MSPPIVIVDAEGNNLTPPPPKKTPKFVLKLRPSKEVTPGELEKLEDCIFADVKKRNEFLNIYRGGGNNETFDEYLEKHMNRRTLALKYCWETKNWRPSACGNRVVLHHPNNKYSK